jgi:hypothetical protein
MEKLNKRCQGIMYERPRIHMSTFRFNTYDPMYNVLVFQRMKEAVHRWMEREARQQSFGHPSRVVEERLGTFDLLGMHRRLRICGRRPH